MYDKKKQLEALLAQCAPHGHLALAFSGGLDSRFLACFAQGLGLRPLLLHVTGPQLAESDSAQARVWARQRGLELLCLRINPLDRPELAANGRNRCYFCKKTLMQAMQDTIRKHRGDHRREDRKNNRQKVGPPLLLCEGSNASDLSEYRPGIKALQELGIRSPLAESGLTKPEIRLLAGQLDLDRPNQRPRPCMLTRFAYDLPPTTEALLALARAEAAIEMILLERYGESRLPDYRLRKLSADRQELHIDARAQQELDEAGLAARLAEAVHSITGLPLAAIRFEAKLSGFFDRASS